MKDLSIKISNYKCFGSEAQGFDGIFPINIIIGKNNSGKSSIIEVISYLANYEERKKNPLSRNGEPSNIFFIKNLLASDIEFGFKKNVSGGGIPGSHNTYGNQWIGQPMGWSLKGPEVKFESITNSPASGAMSYFGQIASSLSNPLAGYKHIGLAAERDLEPDSELESIAPVSASGQFATNMVWHFVNKRSMDRDLVEVILLAELNKIFNPDSNFTRILLDKVDTNERYNGKWEIVLVEENKGRIPLSESGSGLKTILLVLIFLYLVPAKERKKIENYFFTFEELENNLHPSLQKRLFGYLRNKAIAENGKFIITTHSPVVIDLFSNDPEARMFHVQHDGKNASVKALSDFTSKSSALDDLGVKPSDLLQANCIIWVEGPSDKVYINRWISLLSEGSLLENYHYQFLYYGGRLLSHYSVGEPASLANDFINILSLNYNAIVVVDSDKNVDTDDINETKKRIKGEIEASNGFFWLTDGKEIENYLPLTVINKIFNSASTPLQPYEDIKDYLNALESSAGTKFDREKVKYAKLFSEHFTRENIEGTQLFEKITDVITHIKKFNEL